MTEAETPPTSDDEAADDTRPTPGDAKGVPVPHEHSMEGTSEQTPAVDGVFTYPEAAKPATEAGEGD